ncbi:type II toxin-antitoxin system PemK/MazF family toxin [Stenotrophomonas sp.]|uniref:type II toxin-antitoxin system PemK/MazF family toxin n=1 Tax=Stenotrophomonas sp. TaxID=69392 RepID=UPI00289B16A6|nr:type II toxin-antitoxin system PemK/MazF family toxin [Stenotrophomonas sp.]
MPDLTINYVQRITHSGKTDDIALGSEILIGVSEALLPRVEPESLIFLTKKFTTHDCQNWIVHAVERRASSESNCAEFTVFLEAPLHSGASEYLHQTLIKGKRRTIQHTVRPGSLIEVDYGHELRTCKSDGAFGTNECYSDTVQNGEMHKRRLAIVVSARRQTALQVVPISSQPPSPTDKTAFELSAETLRKLKFYGSSGKRSWAACSMIETVSTRRVQPPISYFTSRGSIRAGRDTHYSVSLNNNERKCMKECLLHSINVRDYHDTHQSLSQANARLSVLELRASHATELSAQIEALKVECAELQLCKEVAEMWARSLGLELTDEVQILKSLYAENRAISD